MSFSLKNLFFKVAPKSFQSFYTKTIYKSKIEKNNSLTSYSQYGEDLIIKRILGVKRSGFYVDVGAFHPIKFSNTYMFYKLGWRGINIEANSDYLNLFKQLRNRDINLNIAISDHTETLSYYKFNKQAVNTFNKEHAESWSQQEGSILKEIVTVQAYTLKQILDKHLKHNQKIDFMSIDVEGYDLKVLKSNDWDTYRPQLLLVEENNETIDSFKSSNVFKYLSALDYKLYCISGPTMVFKDIRN